MMGLGWLAMGLFWLLLVIAAVWLLRVTNPDNRLDSDLALSLAKERYAKGEISGEEFSALKKNLER